ncbi:hypothetical protein ABTZ59_02275 [Streptomyces sp. NPDC094034]
MSERTQQLLYAAVLAVLLAVLAVGIVGCAATGDTWGPPPDRVLST